MQRPLMRPWERNYPDGVRWDAEIARDTLPDLLARSARNFPDRAAIEFRDRPISYSELGAMVDHAAAAYLGAGLAKGTTVGLFLGNTPDHPINFFGVTKAGARVVHLSPLDGERALSHKVKDSGAKIVVTANLAPMLPLALKFLDQGLIEKVIVCRDERWGESGNIPAPLPDRREVITFEAFAEGAAAPARWPEVTADDIAAFQYTGGTTGLPKGAILTHGNLTAANAIFEAWAAPQRVVRGNVVEKVICVLPLFHIFALVTVLIRSLSRGNHILLHQRFDAETVLRDIEVKRATMFPGVPTMWIAIANFPGVADRDFSSLYGASSGGAPLPDEVAKLFASKTGIALGGGWGMTETCSAGTSKPRGAPSRPGMIGVPLPGIDLDIVSLDDPTKVLPAGVTGELRVRGPNVTRGYWNREKETAKAFSTDGFLTGDVGYADEDGYFYIVDRKTDMIISGGFNVYPQMVEQAIYEHSAVQEVVVIGIPDDYRGEAAKAFVKLRAGAQPFTLDELREFLSGKLGRHELPTALEFRDELPRTNVGKLSRQELRESELREQQPTGQPQEAGQPTPKEMSHG